MLRASVSETCTGIGALHENFVMGDRAGVLYDDTVKCGGLMPKAKRK